MIDRQIMRARWHDYRQPGFYMITMVTEGRRKVFGRLVGDSEDEARVELSELGMVLDEEIRGQMVRHPDIAIEEWTILEDHCHLLVHVRHEMRDHLGKVVWGIKYGTTAAYLNALTARTGIVHRVEGTRLSQSARTSSGNTAANTARTNVRCGASNVRCGASASSMAGASASVITVPPLWQKGYHDRIVTSRRQIESVKRYIARNAARLWQKRHTDRSATRVTMRRLPINIDLARRLKDTATYWDQRRTVYHSPFTQRHDNLHYADSYVGLVQQFLRYNADARQTFLRLKQCGNAALLDSGRPLVRVRISRSVTQTQFEEELHRILDLCEREGAIPVSPFRSWSEKAMLRILRMNGFAHIIIHGEAMWDGWKPQDGSTASHRQMVPQWFINEYQPVLYPLQSLAHAPQDTPITDSDLTEVYAGRCLFLAPWHDRPRSDRAGKADCEVMNELCAVMEQINQ